MPTARTDPFARLVREVASDPDSAFNIEEHLWVLEEPAPEVCSLCGDLFDPALNHHGGLASGTARRYCSSRCAGRAAYQRRTARAA
jgi:hypothetical protein